MKTLKMMPDYECWALWAIEDWGPDNIDPATLPLDAPTVADLNQWAETFTQTLNRDDPAESGFDSQQEFERFEKRGLRLWQRLQGQLAPNYRVKYQSLAYSTLFDTPEEWERVTNSRT